MNAVSEPAHISDCTRCGTCCKKGGPCFHIEDKLLIEKGLILSKHLYTIRKGENVYDNVRENIQEADSDIIKIKSRKSDLACVFFDENENRCKIYENRPAECKALKCWDTLEIEQIYYRNRLERKDITGRIEGLWELVEDHQARCDYKIISGIAKNLNNDNMDDGAGRILEIVRYDAHIRRLAVEKGSINPGIADFLFGRPMTETIRNYIPKKLFAFYEQIGYGISV
ncbi:MAG: YkgJ family cysteine cluster protein [Desulfobacteraceae bacterium]|nr:YkgJ family cysteine cluster protein [Desulfobacteraceae bacterium]